MATLARVAAALADGVEAALPGWVQRCVERVWAAQRHGPVPDDVRAATVAAGRRAAEQIGVPLRALLGQDVDEQRTNPLSVIRGAARYPTEVLRDVGVTPVDRDAEAQRQFPDDPYDLTPMSFADVDPDLHEPGIVWGAAKAHVHLTRRRAEGRR